MYSEIFVEQVLCSTYSNMIIIATRVCVCVRALGRLCFFNDATVCFIPAGTYESIRHFDFFASPPPQTCIKPISFSFQITVFWDVTPYSLVDEIFN